MSNRNKRRLSLKGDPNVPTTEPSALPEAETNARIQETVMEAAVETTQEKSLPEAQAPIELTAKQMAEAEAVNAQRARALMEQRNAEAEKSEEPVSIIGLAAQGREVLLDGLRKHAEQSKPKEYIPPPRTPRQMEALQEELEAGRRAQQRAQDQLAARPAPERDPNEGFTNPVHRPGDVVPDPTVAAPSGFAAGNRGYGPDA